MDLRTYAPKRIISYDNSEQASSFSKPARLAWRDLGYYIVIQEHCYIKIASLNIFTSPGPTVRGKGTYYPLSEIFSYDTRNVTQKIKNKRKKYPEFTYARSESIETYK